jgi:UDP-N-acetylmuramate dehydrogenase
MSERGANCSDQEGATADVIEAIEAAAAALGDHARRGVPLGPLTTYRVGGPAALFCTIATDEELGRVAAVVARTGIEVLVVGKGSNLLVADAGFAGLAVVLGEAFAGVEVGDVVDDVVTVRAGAAAALPVVARRTASAGLTGFEWAVGVPGSIGGAVRMNAGGHGSDMAASLRRVRVVDLACGEDGVVSANGLDLSYRHSALRSSEIVLWAELGLSRGDRTEAEAEIADIVRWRRANQPGGQNAGSVFTNPPDDSAGRLIDAAGCKGRRLGSASVSSKHANFFQADDGGSADDVFALMADVRRRVAGATGVMLKPETRLIGFRPSDDSKD